MTAYDDGLMTTLTPEQRLWARIDKHGPNGCWLWTGATTYGYGVIGWTGRKTKRTHRLAYELLVGPIPAGLELDHTCHNADLTCAGGVTCIHRRCANPAHLEPVTGRTNVLRGQAPTAINKRKTHCYKGHAFDAENTHVSPITGRRRCRKCSRTNDVRRGVRLIDLRAAKPKPVHYNAQKTHCRQGHPFDEANTVVDKNGWRRCKTCRVLTNLRRSHPMAGAA